MTAFHFQEADPWAFCQGRVIECFSVFLETISQLNESVCFFEFVCCRSFDLVLSFVARCRYCCEFS